MLGLHPALERHVRKTLFRRETKMILPELKDGMVIKCINNQASWWYMGTEYPVINGCITDEDGDAFYKGDGVSMEFEIINKLLPSEYKIGEDYLASDIGLEEQVVTYKGTNKHDIPIVELKDGSLELIGYEGVLKPMPESLQEQLCSDLRGIVDSGKNKNIHLAEELVKLGWTKA